MIDIVLRVFTFVVLFVAVYYTWKYATGRDQRNLRIGGFLMIGFMTASVSISNLEAGDTKSALGALGGGLFIASVARHTLKKHNKV